MADIDIKDILEDCKKSASIGYKIAFKQHKALKNTLSEAAGKVQSTMVDFQTSPCYVSGATDMLSQQLVEIESSFNNLSFAFVDDLQNLRNNLAKFSITLFGRTMAGKSTLMEILTGGDGSSIGKGAQRTTLDVRKYTWNNLEITDVPGIGAFKGEDDEQIAFEAAKMTDLILFLVTDDGPKPIEAEWFGRIVNLGKPIICVMNVKAAISEGSNYKLGLRDIEKRFDMQRLDEIKSQFLSYAQLLGQDWGYVPFVYVHLKSAFLSQQVNSTELAEKLYYVSRVDILKKKIIEQVRTRGEFYRIKTFIDIISNPILHSMESLLSHSLTNSAQGRAIVSKKRQVEEWENIFLRDGRKRIESLINSIRSQLFSEIAAFAEDHYDDPKADKAWNDFISKRNLSLRCQELLEELETQCNEKIKEVSREISTELQFAASFAGDRTLRMHQIIDGKKIWDWSVTIAGGGLTIAAIITSLCGAAISGPLGWAAIAVSVIGSIGSLAFKSRERKEQEARQRLETNLKHNVEKICDSLDKQLVSSLESLVSSRIDALLKEMDRINSVVFRLADTQRDLAWELDTHLLELNSNIIKESFSLAGEAELFNNIKGVARIPGNSTMLMLNDGVLFPEDKKKQIRKILSEKIWFVYDTENKRILISRVIGKEIDRNNIQLEEKIGVAHVQVSNVSPKLNNRIRMAQQFTKVVITY